MSALDNAAAAFMRSGIIKLPQAFDFSSGSLLDQWRNDVLEDLEGTSPRLIAPHPSRKVKLDALAPDLWALCQLLLGGSQAVEDSWFTDGPVANIGPNPTQSLGWHIDGDFFNHYLDSPEQGLLIVVLWTDVSEKGGPTLVLPDSIQHIAKALVAMPKGCKQMDLPYHDIVTTCQPPLSLYGQAGDAFIMHPFIVHTASPKYDCGIRLISNPVVRRRCPFDFAKGGDCAVSKYTLAQLGLDGIDMRNQKSEDWFVPPRLNK